MGGRLPFRPVWRHFYDGLHAIIFVVDAADTEQMPESKEELGFLLNEEELSQVKFLIFANKQDLENALSAGEVAAQLGLFDELGRKHPLAKTRKTIWSTVMNDEPYKTKSSPIQSTSSMDYQSKSSIEDSQLLNTTGDYSSNSFTRSTNVTVESSDSTGGTIKTTSSDFASNFTEGNIPQTRNESSNPRKVISGPLKFPRTFHNRWFVQASIGATGEGLIDGFVWIAKSLNSSKSKRKSTNLKQSRATQRSVVEQPSRIATSAGSSTSFTQEGQNSLFSNHLSPLTPRRPMTPSPSLLRLESSQSNLTHSVSMVSSLYLPQSRASVI